MPKKYKRYIKDVDRFLLRKGVNMKNDLLISVAENHMKDKKYDPQVSLIGYIKGFINDSQTLAIAKKDLKKGLKEITHLTYHKLNVVIDSYVE